MSIVHIVQIFWDPLAYFLQKSLLFIIKNIYSSRNTLNKFSEKHFMQIYKTSVSDLIIKELFRT